MSKYHEISEELAPEDEKLPLVELFHSFEYIKGGSAKSNTSKNMKGRLIFWVDAHKSVRGQAKPKYSWRSHFRGEHRKLEDVDYWRKRAGWYDDDAKMTEYNQGVYDTYYSVTDDQVSQGGSGSSTTTSFFGSGDVITSSIKVFAGIVGLAIFLLLVRALRRRSSGGKKKSTRRGFGGVDPDTLTRSQSSKGRSSSRARSASRARSKSGERLKRSRSRSRARRHKEEEDSGKDYNLMEEGEKEKESKSSSRSKSRDKKRSSRSRSRARKESSGRKESMLV